MRTRLNNPSVCVGDTDFSGGAAWIVVQWASRGSDHWDMEIRPSRPGNALHRALLRGRDAAEPLLIRTSDTVRWFEGRIRVSGLGPTSSTVACVGVGGLRSILSGEGLVGSRRANRA
jgi:hypothetical protein